MERLAKTQDHILTGSIIMATKFTCEGWTNLSDWCDEHQCEFENADEFKTVRLALAAIAYVILRKERDKATAEAFDTTPIE